MWRERINFKDKILSSSKSHQSSESRVFLCNSNCCEFIHSSTWLRRAYSCSKMYSAYVSKCARLRWSHCLRFQSNVFRLTLVMCGKHSYRIDLKLSSRHKCCMFTKFWKRFVVGFLLSRHCHWQRSFIQVIQRNTRREKLTIIWRWSIRTNLSILEQIHQNVQTLFPVRQRTTKKCYSCAPVIHHFVCHCGIRVRRNLKCTEQ